MKGEMALPITDLPQSQLPELYHYKRDCCRNKVSTNYEPIGNQNTSSDLISTSSEL